MQHRAVHKTGLRWALSVILLLAPLAVFGQAGQQIGGRVTDQSGAVVPNASVTVHNELTGVDRTTETTNLGEFTVPFLNPGIYDVSVSVAGFQTVTRTKLNLSTGQALEADFALKLGKVSETVTVDSSAVVLDYDKADRGDIMENRRIEELPVNSDNLFTLPNLTAGANFGASYVGPLYDNQTAQNLQIHGQAVEFNIDGVTNLAGVGAQNYDYSPPVTAVQEFKITTNPYDAAQGRSAGGSIDITLKSGTSKLHGNAYEYAQRAFMNANSSTSDAHIAATGPSPIYNKAAYTQNQYGFELDGPVLIPRLLGANRKTFFTIQYESFKVSQLYSNNTSSVPTQAMIKGDFSALLTANGAKYNQPIYDPASEAACTANNTDNGSYSAKNPHACRYQFGYGPGTGKGPQGNPVLIGTPNVVPANRIDSVAAAILSWYPTSPNLTPTPSTANDFANNNVWNPPGVNQNRTYLLKLDNQLNPNDSFSLTLRWWTEFGVNSGSFVRDNVNSAHSGINYAATAAHFTKHYQDPGLTAGWVHTFSANMVNSLKASVLSSDRSDTSGPASGYDPSNLGLPTSFGSASPTQLKRFPVIGLNSMTGLGSSSGGDTTSDVAQITDVANYTHGNHNIHFGGEVRTNQYSNKVPSGGGLSLSFDKGWTQQWDIVTTGGATGISSSAGYSGNAAASMLLGTATSGTATIVPGLFETSKYYTLYFQDDWKVRPRLVLNLGLRWESIGNGDTDRQNRQVGAFDVADVNPISSMVNFTTLNGNGIGISQLKGGITYAGVGNTPRGSFHTNLKQFGPRFAFAYTARTDTVVRGGIGLFYTDSGSGNSYAPSQTGYTSTTNYTGTTDGGVTPLNNLDNPFPTLQPALGNCGGNQSTCLMTNAGQSLSFINPNYHPPLVLNSSFGVEHQFSKWDTLEVSYAGVRVYDATYSYDINHIGSAAQAYCDPERGGTGTNCTSGASTGTGGYVTNPFVGLSPFVGTSYYTAATIQRINFSRPYPQFTSVTESNLNGGESYYNALEATYNHRTSAGLSLHATYTYSKGIYAAGYADVVNNVSSRTVYSTDMPHRLTLTEVYLLPIGRGYGLFPHLNRYADLVLGGWQASSIFTFQSGLPATISGYEINRSANGGYILPRKRYWPGQSDPNHSGAYAPTNSYVSAFKPCVATRDPNTGVVTMETYTNTTMCPDGPNFIAVGSYGATPNVEYTGIRLQHYVNLDANISKNFKVYKDANFQLRLDAFNTANHVTQYSTGYDTTAGDSNFGTYQMGTSAGGNIPNRQIQISGRLSF